MRELAGAQHSDAWLANRCGRITASRMGDLMATLKRGGESAARRNYRMELIAARLTGRSPNHFVTPEMERGSEMECEAITNYEIARDELVEPVGFVLHPRFDFAGASPDGLVGRTGMIQVKCPKTETFLEWLKVKQIPEDYRDQMLWEMRCCDPAEGETHSVRDWSHFFGYDDRFKEGPRHLLLLLERDDARIALLEEAAEEFNAGIETEIANLGFPPTAWTIPLKAEPEPEPDAGESGFDPASEAFDYIDAQEIVP